MDFGKSNQAPKSKCRDFDLNLPYLEDLDSKDESGFSSLIQNNTQNTIGMNITAANEALWAGLALLTNIVAQVLAGDAVVFPESHTTDDGYQGISMRGRRRYRTRGRAHPTDHNRLCTNVNCKTRKTPMWRKGPLGPKTLCNACGIFYKKLLKSGGNNIPIIGGDASASSSSSSGSASPGTVNGNGDSPNV